MRRHPEVPFWISVGDLADDDGHYQPVDAPLYWIKGNNENFDPIESRRSAREASLHDERPDGRARRRARCGAGRHVCADVVRDRLLPICHTPRRASPRATSLADKRRHFVREEVEACQALRERRCVPDATKRHARISSEAVPDVAVSTPGRRRSTKCWRPCVRACTSSGITIGSPSRSARASVRLGSNVVSSSYLLIEPTMTLDYS